MFAVWKDFDPNTSFPARGFAFDFALPSLSAVNTHSLSNLTFPTYFNQQSHRLE
jgi:hypothetical protein